MADLFELPFDPRHFINEHAWFRDEGDLRVVFTHHLPLLQYPRTDRVMERLAMAELVETGSATMKEVADAFEVHRMTVSRCTRLLREGGTAALFDGKSGPKGPHSFREAVRRQVVELRQDGETFQAIATRLGMSVAWAYALCKEAGLVPAEVGAAELPGIEGPETSPQEIATEAPLTPSAGIGAAPEKVASPIVADAHAPQPCPPPSSRETAALFAMINLTPDGEAETCFEASEKVAHAGVLLAIPLLPSLGLLEGVRSVYRRMKNGIYGLRATVLVLFSMALLRVKRAEGLKAIFPDALGRVLGLLRVPEVKTIRRKLKELAERAKAHVLIQWLGLKRAEEAPRAMGFLYVDGHVRAYHGKRWIPKAFSTARKQVLPATTDYWVNDRDGQPVLVLPTEANPGLVQVLPSIAAAVREIVGPERRVTLAFDRGGWSPELFSKILALGFDVLTYRKGKIRPLARKLFHEETTWADGKKHTYLIAEAETRLSDGPVLRRIAVLRADGKCTEIVTSRRDLPAALLAYRMFSRWRQENYFKYMLEEFAIDGLVEYAEEPADPDRTVPNPRKKVQAKRLANARAEVAKWEGELAKCVEGHEEAGCRTMRGFKIANARIRKELEWARQRVALLQQESRRIPTRVPVKALASEDTEVIKLAVERKLLVDAVKMAAYRAETKLVQLVGPHFARNEDEGRRLIKEALALSGDLLVDGTQVTVRLQPMSAPRFTRALVALCAALNEMDTRFPESPYHLRYEVEGAE